MANAGGFFTAKNRSLDVSVEGNEKHRDKLTVLVPALTSQDTARYLALNESETDRSNFNSILSSPMLFVYILA